MSNPFPDEPTAWLPAMPASRPAWWRRPVFLVPAAVVLALVVLGGVGLLLLRGHATPPAKAAPVPAASSAAPKGAHDTHAVRGAIVSETGSTWTVRLTNGRTVTVLVNPQTRFGTAKHPQAAGDFPVGTTVVVTGTTDQSTVTATRIAPAAQPARSSPAATPSG